jgi:hypothetical protein
VFDLYDYSLLTIFLVGLAAILASIEIGRWLGVHVGGQGDDNVSTLEGAAIGLLALMVGFTFAMSLSRFEVRRDAILAEANAIGTTAFCDVCFQGNSGHCARLLYPQKRTLELGREMSAMCQWRTSGADLFDHFVGAGKQCRRDCKAESLGGLEVDHQLVPSGRLHGQVARLFSFQNAIDI